VLGFLARILILTWGIRLRYFATDRTDRKTYIAQGWVAKDPQVLADVGLIPEGEAVIEIPEDVLRFYVRRYREGEH
jgi:hypothetical protein